MKFEETGAVMADRGQAGALDHGPTQRLEAPERLAERAESHAASELAASPERFINRELSWLNFNRRVLEEFRQREHPLLERLRSRRSRQTTSTNSSWCAWPACGRKCAPASPPTASEGLTPAEQLVRIAEAVVLLVRDQQEQWLELRSALRKAGIVLIDGPDVTKSERAWLEDYFLSHIFPLLTPLAIDPRTLLPFIPNLGFSIALQLSRAKDGRAMNLVIRMAEPHRAIRAAAAECRAMARCG